VEQEERKDFEVSFIEMDENSKEFDYMKVIRAVESMPFNVGKNLLIDFLQGNLKNESVKRNSLNKMPLFGFLQLYSRKEVEEIVENLLSNNLLEYQQLPENRFIKVIAVTEKGKRELANPSHYKKKLSNRFIINETEITEEDKTLFQAFDFFLKPYNDEQKKAVISTKNKILCVAGAGSGKTTVLTKRIEFLTKFRSINPSKILAITFTRKARSEMIARLSKSPYCEGVRIETFNSFCEKILKEHNDLIYEKDAKLISYSQKVKLFNAALRENNINANDALSGYFSFAQRAGRTSEELLLMLMNDCCSILELYKSNNKNINTLLEEAKILDAKNSNNLRMVYRICKYIDLSMKKLGLRDYTDQLIHCINFFKQNPKLVPVFEHVLVDEYQDVNSAQIELIDLLNPASLFCVGDPRQSIFGWRGSQIKYILNFEEKHPDCEIITLSTNYRSSKQIVELINSAMESARLPELKHFNELNAEIKLIGFDSEDDEINFVVNKIKEIDISKNEIFVLARTNRIISELADRMKLNGIKHIVRTEEHHVDIEAAKDEVTLATVHSIKGLEADTVFVVGCNGLSFPCKTSEHPVMELTKIYDYDKEDEERRLFYVAMSRAKNRLYLTYSGKPTRFVTDKMINLLKSENQKSKPLVKNIDVPLTRIQNFKNSEVNLTANLKEWRAQLAREYNLPAYIIMHDKTIMEIIENNPSTIEELRKVKGIGPAKLEKYGNDILRILNGRA